MKVISLKEIKKITTFCALFIIICIGLIEIVDLEDIGKDKDDILSSSATISDFDSLNNKKIEWGIKRNDNNIQPDLGSKNKEIMDKYNGLAMGNSDKPYIYLTFDMGYEAGYTEKILEVLKANGVNATFFITAHYLNTQPELVKRMIEDGHIIGNHSSYALMDTFKS